MKAYRFFFITLIVICLTISLNAEWSNDPAMNTIVSNSDGEQAIPKIGNCPNGDVYLSWFSNENGNYNVRLQRFDENGNEMWEHNGILISNNVAMTWLTDWDMKADNEGNAIIAFQDIRTGVNDIFVYKISGEGNFIWGENGIQLSNSDDFSASPKIAVANDNTVIVSWSCGDFTYIKKINADGSLSWDEAIQLSAPDSVTWPQLLAVGDDDFILKYFVDSGPYWAPTRHVFAQRYDGTGTEVWNSPTVITDQGGITAWTQIFSFVSDGNNGFFIGWHEDRDGDQKANIYVQHIDEFGNPIFAANGIEVCIAPNRNHFEPKIAFSEDSGNLYVFWNEMNGNQDLRGIYGQKISPTGDLMWEQSGAIFSEISNNIKQIINTKVIGEDAVCFYESFEFGNSMDASINAFRINISGDFVWENETIQLCSVASEKVHPVAGNLSNNQWIVAWEDSRNETRDIYAQNIQIDGNLGVTANEHIYGDIDDNGEVQAFDASMVLQYVVGILSDWEDWQIWAADVDGDENIMAFDASLILQYSVGLITEFPVETERMEFLDTDVSYRIENKKLIFSSKEGILSMELTTDFQIRNFSTSMLNAVKNNKIAMASSTPVIGDFLTISLENKKAKIIEFTVNNGNSQSLNILNDIDFLAFDQVLGNYPNPFNPKTSIRLNIVNNNTKVSVQIFNVKGELINSIYNGFLNNGIHNIEWNGFDKENNNVSSGVYFYKIKMGNTNSTGKMLMLK